MWDQICVIGVPKISTQESVKAVINCPSGANFWNDVWTDCRGAQDLHSGKCRGSQICPAGANFRKDVWTEWGSWSAQDLKPGKSRSSRILFLSGADFWKDVWTDRGYWSAPDLKPGKCWGNWNSEFWEYVRKDWSGQDFKLRKCWDFQNCPWAANLWKVVWTHWGSCSAQDLKPGKCAGNLKFSFRYEILRRCVIRSGLLKCPRSQARTVLRQSKLFPQERISERMCEQIGVVEVPKGKCGSSQN